jgi:hypothetical protein
MKVTYASEISGVFRPMTEYTMSTYQSLNISSSGLASGSVKVNGYPDIVKSISIYMYLEQYVNNSWQTVSSWSDSASSYTLTLSGSAQVSSGYKYRIKASYYVSNGTLTEHLTKYSEEKTY